MKNSVFREKSLKRISSPEQLNDYIKVSNPSIWLVLGALGIMLIAAFIWSISGNITSKVDATGVFQDIDGKPGIETVVCFVGVDDSQKLTKDMEVRLYNKYKPLNDYIIGKVSKISQVPVKQEDILSDFSNEFIAKSILETGYGVAVLVSVEQDSSSPDGLKWSNSNHSSESSIEVNDLCRVEIITESITPIDFLLGKGV
ncbi:MAG: hypothetical protein RUMPE_00782 [Eubacteriales bacterium SKADARSKE-1]|nr:hypothetical protein [Eubacteriales bacterium SKADARSKE-1]